MSFGAYVNGKWYNPSNSPSIIKNINPAEPDDIISEFPGATAHDVQLAIQAAEKAFPSWSSTPGPERGRVLLRAANIIRERAEEIARMMTREEGKTIQESRGEVLKGLALLEYYAGEGYRMGGRTTPAEARDVFSFTLRKPLGVVALISPFNFPWANPMWKLCPALVTGNTVLLKPSELTPMTASLIVEIFHDAGLPPGVLNLLIGLGKDVGDAIVEAPQIKAISFTGSNAIGMAINVKAATLGKKVSCEMGGKNAVVVLDDADLDKATQAIIGGAFGSTGQRCTATSRIVVTASVKEELLARLIEKANQLKIGNGLDESVDIGPAVSDSQLKKDLSYVEVAKQDGAKLVCGGKRPKNLGNGYYIEPTIFDKVLPNMRIFQEEVFGPVLSIVTAKSIDEAFAFANQVPFGLSTAIFSQDINSIMHYINKAETGMVHINEPTIGGEAQLPFGGVKATSIGDREMSDEGLNFFSHTKTVFLNYSNSAERSMMR
jgi:aldehyde dehydrogenase (NAD+)